MTCYLCGAAANGDLCPDCKAIADPVEIAMKQNIANYFRKQAKQ